MCHTECAVQVQPYSRRPRSRPYEYELVRTEDPPHIEATVRTVHGSVQQQLHALALQLCIYTRGEITMPPCSLCSVAGPWQALMVVGCWLLVVRRPQSAVVANTKQPATGWSPQLCN
jgi:hypothetical protein